MGGCVKTLRSLVFIFNLFFWIAGIIIIGLGVWLLWDPVASDFFALHSTHHGSFQIVGWLLLAAGAITTFVGCCGCCGAWKMNQGALVGFFVVLVIVFCFELAAAYMAYSKQETIQQYIESSMYDTIRNRYASDANYKSAFDTIQREFECCGVKSYADWLGASWDRKLSHTHNAELKVEHGIGAIGSRRENGYGRTPFSCCNDHGKEIYPTKCGVSFIHAPLETYAEFLYSKGCADAVYESVYRHLNLVIAVCVIVGAIQVMSSLTVIKAPNEIFTEKL
ncbi:tetraspanin family protein [Dictyocaulus viviparus]|uniref:Tetraspanin n=1 Tax=Dictyocaulus viviparus TaxID=29172 RepID=A0A0D8XJ70_DICVI|nr:tetraspanin family protein [Dictyocaulus viviparus]